MKSRILQIALCMGLLTRGLTAQTPNLEQGFKPYGSYHGGDIDSVNLSNGNVTMHAPLVSYPQRGGKLGLSFSLVYNNKGWYVYSYTDHTVNPPVIRYKWKWGGTGVEPVWNEEVDWQKTSTPDDGPIVYSALTADGASPAFGCLDTTNCYTMETMDGSGFRLDLSSSKITTRAGVRETSFSLVANGGPHGTPTYAPALLEDGNGNQITANASGWTDTLGRLIPGSKPNGRVIPGVATTDFSGCPTNAVITGARIWNLPAYNGSTAVMKFCYAAYALQSNFGFSDIPDASAAATMLSGVVLPNQTTWQFNYNSVGDLSSITLPTGGSISYGWQNARLCTNSFTPASRAIVSRSVDSLDGTGAKIWTYTWGASSTNVVHDPMGNDAVHTFSGFRANDNPTYSSCPGYETSAQYYQGSQTSGTLLKTVNTAYDQSMIYENPQDAYLGGPIPPNLVGVTPSQVTTIWPNGQQSQQQTDHTFANVNWYDLIGTTWYARPLLLGNVAATRDYDYGQGAPGTLLRTTATTYAWQSPNPNYSSYLTDNLLDLAASVQVKDGGGTQQAYTTYGYDESSLQSSGITMQHDSSPPNGTIRGNQTSVHRLLNSGTFTCPGGGSGGSGGFVVSSTTYYDTGKVYSASDPCSHSTGYQYSSTYYGAYPTTVTNALNQSTTNAYDFNIGLLTSTTDPNQVTITYSYDSMSRLAQANHPDGGSDAITRQEASFPFTATLTSTINPNQNNVPLSVFDGLGRVSQTRLTSDPQSTAYTDTTYDALGRVHSVSNPYRQGTDATSSPGVTTYTYDALGRKTQETYADNSVLTTAYCGPNTLVTDPTGKWRRSRVNGLGQLVEVDEPNAVGATVASTGCPGQSDPIWVTSYTNDVLGNLIQVVQNGSHTRTFTYDSLSRLLTSANPETGTITYTYNPDGTVLTKKDVRLITASYTYDALHRETGVSYSNGDPSLTFTYDGTSCLNLATPCQNIGHRTSMTDGAGSESWAYKIDKTHFQSIHREQRTTNSSPNNITKTTTYYLDLAGNVTQLVYPTGRTVNYTHDSANRPSSATDAANGITYAADWKTPPSNTSCTAGAVCYTPQGSIYSMSIGQTSSFTGFNISETFNNRLQPNEIKASSSAGTAIDITYNFIDTVDFPGTTNHNAGHVYGIANNLNSSRSQAFTYDQVNRITSAGTTATTGTYCWGYQYSYDAWGNLLAQAGWSPTYNGCTETTMGTVNADGNNHISGLSYDASGNTLGDGNFTYTWDGESQMKTAAGVTYAYDGDGRRVAKVGSKLYWYGSGGEILSETDAAGNTLNEYVFFGGKRVALVPASGGALYYAEDLLGSSRVMVQANGTLCYDADFTPFGGERSYTSTCAQTYKFEGKERDSETQNDDFGARYYSWRLGRWLSSDWSAVPVPVPYANLANPQTLNLYSMVEDDPESFADLDGHGDGTTPTVSVSASGSTKDKCPLTSGVNLCSGSTSNVDDGGGQGAQKQKTYTIQVVGPDGKRHDVALPVGSQVLLMKESQTIDALSGAVLRTETYTVNDVTAKGLRQVGDPTEVLMKEQGNAPGNCAPGCTNKANPSDYQAGRFVDDNTVRRGGPFESRQQYFIGSFKSSPALDLRSIVPGVFDAGRTVHVKATYDSVSVGLEP